MPAALLLVIGYVVANTRGYREAYTKSRNLELALASLYSEKEITPDVGQLLYAPDDEHLRRQIVTLKTASLGPFAKQMDGEKARLTKLFAGGAATGRADGFQDGGDCYRTEGWAWDPSEPDTPIMVDVWFRGVRIGTVEADWFRWDLRAAGKGNGQHAFIFYFPTMLKAGTGEAITVTYAGTSNRVRGSPKVIMCG